MALEDSSDDATAAFGGPAARLPSARGYDWVQSVRPEPTPEERAQWLMAMDPALECPLTTGALK